MTARTEIRLLAAAVVFFALALVCATQCAAEEPTTTTGASAYFGAERILSSFGPAQDEMTAIAFGQVGFGRSGAGGWLLSTGTLQPGQLDVSRVRTIELGLAPHWYAYQQQGVAVGITAWLGGSFGYDSSGAVLKTRAPLTWGIGPRFGGHGAWGFGGFGDHEVVGRNAIQALAHLPMGDRTAVSGDFARSLHSTCEPDAKGMIVCAPPYQIRLRAYLGWP